MMSDRRLVGNDRGKVIAGLLVIVGLAACAVFTPKPPRPPLDTQIEIPRIVALSEANVRENWELFSRCTQDDVSGMRPAWDVLQGTAVQLDSMVRHQLRMELRRVGAALSADQYMIQYLGVFFEEKKAVLANGVAARGASNRVSTGNGSSPYNPLTEAAQKYGRSAPIVVCDGGVVRFTVVVTPSGEELRHFRFNIGFDGMRY